MTKKAVILLLLILVALPLNSYSAVLINEILANGVSDPDSEWVELFNNGSSEVNLTNFNISETSSKNFTLNTTIPSNSFIVLVENFTLFNSTFPNVNQNGIKIIEYGEITPNFELSNTKGNVTLYNSSGNKIDNIDYVQSTTQENISIGRYPDGSSSIFNLSTLTPGAKNDNQAPKLRWIKPSRNNTNISGLTNITVNITDDTTQVNSSIINFNGTNFSMAKHNDLWTFLWNTSLNVDKQYSITIFSNDSYGKSGSDILFNTTVNNSPFITSFSPLSLTQTVAENATLSFQVNSSDPDDALLNYSWFIDNKINNTNPVNFSYTPGFNDSGTHTINVTIKDPSLNQVSMKWTVVVTNANRAPVLDAISNKLASKNINLSFNISAIDLDNDSLTFSSNHSGIAISKISNSLATVSWKPTNRDLGNHTVNFTVSDSFLMDSKIVVITVNVTTNIAPNITSLPKTSAIINEKYSYDVDAKDLDNDALNFSLKSNASGISIDSSSGLISFTPASFGFFSVNVSVTDFVDIAVQSYNLTIIEGSKLKITNVDVKIDTKKSDNVGNNTKISKEAEPGSNVEFKIKVKNDFSKSEDVDIKDIEVKVTIQEIDDDDDLEEEAREFDLEAQDDKSVALKFALPLNIDDGTFDVLIEAEGEDKNGNKQEQNFEIELEVEKENQDIRFLEFDILPQEISCSRAVALTYKIINIGQEDEENSMLEIKSNDLELNYIEKNISIESGTEGNTFSNSIKLKIDDEIENSAYPIIANIYSDDEKLRDTKIAELKVEDCFKLGEAEEKVSLLANPSEKSEETKLIKGAIQNPTTMISFKEDDKMLLLVFSTFMFTIFFVFTAIILFLKF